MLLAGSDDGVYRIDGIETTDDLRAERVLEADQLYRICRFDAVEGVFATAESGLYYAPDGRNWTRLSLPEEQVFSVTADPSGDRIYAGTRPARIVTAEWDGSAPSDGRSWTELDGFRTVREQNDWGIPRHDGRAQIRSLRTHGDAPDRLVAGIEVGGVYVSDDAGANWSDRSIDGFDAPHTDDIHHVAMPDAETLIASTGSGLYRSADVGRTWTRLDAGHPQRYFREARRYGDTIYAGAAPASSASWEQDTDHALFEGCDDGTLERAASPTQTEVPLGLAATGDDVLTVTHEGTVLRRDSKRWRAIGEIPTPGTARGRYLPLLWYDDESV